MCFFGLFLVYFLSCALQIDGIVSKDEDLKSELTGITLGSAMQLLNDLKQTIIFFIPVL